MPGSNNSSFIPKQGTAKKRKTTSTRQVYFFTLISYVLMFAAFIAAGGVYFYEKYVTGQLNEKVTVLNGEIGIFNEEDMQKVLDFDRRLKQAENRLSNSASLAGVFRALEESTIGDIQLESLTLARDGDNFFDLEVNVLTDTFDATIFQREVFRRSQVIDEVEVIDIIASNLGSSGAGGPKVDFTTKLKIPLSETLFTPTASQPTSPAVGNESEEVVNPATAGENPVSETEGASVDEEDSSVPTSDGSDNFNQDL